MIEHCFRLKCDCDHDRKLPHLGPVGKTVDDAAQQADLDGWLVAGDLAICPECKRTDKWPEARVEVEDQEQDASAADLRW